MTERRLSFGGVADLYDRSRPSYPAALVDDVLEFAGAGPSDRALEVGAGTGKATVLFAARGLDVVALEPSAEMAALARRNCAGFENVTIEQTDFERWRGPAHRFRLVFSGQAWHWVTPEIRYAAARAALEDGGALAPFWNVTDWSKTPLRDELLAVYEREAPKFEHAAGPMHPATELDQYMLGDFRADVESAAGFQTPEVRFYDWTCEYTTGEYVELLQTHSDHILFASARRAALLEGIADVLDAHGGRVRIAYLTMLGLARAS
jgi:SAM-dependent methyltransferase